MLAKNNKFSNPIIKDEIEILYESEEKLVFRTYLKPNGGQSGFHYHTKISETFKVIKGELNVIINKNEKKLKDKDQITIREFESHCFYNKSGKNVIFDVEITPAREMKKGLQLFYGLAKDGKVYRNNMPKNIFYLAIGVNMMDAYIPNTPIILQKISISTLLLISKVLGINKRIINKYCF